MMNIFIIISVIIVAKFASTDAVVQTTFPIGGLFNGYHEENTRKTFENIASGNTKRAYLGQTIFPSVTDSYSVAMEVCKNTSDGNGVAALIDFRPTNGICDNTCLLCNRNNISHLVTGWQPTETLSNDLFSFFYHPSPAMISKAFFALIKFLNWDKFTFLYEDENSFIRAQEIINLWPQELEPILYMKLDPKGDNRETFKYVFRVARMSYHILDCDIANVAHYMEEIIQIENATQYQSFILTSLDAHTLDLSSVPSFMANVSTMHLTAPKDVKWQDLRIEQGSGVKLETALAADALTHLEKAIRYFQSQRAALTETEDIEDGNMLPNPPAICYQESKSDYESVAWPLGEELRQALLNTTTKGFTGHIQFDKDGLRENLRLHYSKLNSASTFSYVGFWDSTKDTIEIEEKVEDRSAVWKSGVIRVLSRQGLPYFDIENQNGTDVNIGYVVELITNIFERINKNDTQFQVQFIKAWDAKIGGPIEGTNNKKWDGMIGELMEHNAEMAVCDLSITSERNSVVDFSLPFMMTGISMLFRVEDPPEPDMFSFINPLALDVWLYLATTYIIVSFIILVCARMNQDDWVNPHPCNQNPENLQNIWSLYNCMWLTMGTIMTQGCDIVPRGLGSRWVTGMWYFFAMIITASYTANMSTFLSNSRRSNDIQNAKQLSEQNKVMPGAAYNSSTYNFFKNSPEPVYQKIYSMMSTAKPPTLTKNNDEGKDRVLRGKNKYVFFMESTAIEYYTERNCDLMMVGPELDNKEYGIAMPRNFPHKDKVDKALLQLQESGDLTTLKNKWWTQVGVEGRCLNADDSGGSDSLQMKNTSGIFLVLGVGALLGLVTAIIDFMLHSRQIVIKEKISYKEAIMSEWRASLDPRALHRLAAPPRSAPPTASPSPEQRERSRSRAASVLRAASSFINFDQIY